MPAANESPESPTLQPTWGDWFSCLWSAGSCWFMAAMFVTAWWWPERLDEGRWVKLGVGMMVLEFILIHSGAFLNAFMTQKAGEARNLKLLGLTAYYALFGGAIALAFQSWWIMGSFALVMAGRLWSAFIGQSDMDRAVSQRRVVASAMLFLGLTFATLFLSVPRGGLTEPLLNAVWPTRKSGAWERQPERALAMGAAYFLILGLVEVRPPRKLPPPFRAS
jgi:uncharacterized membrane protein